LQRNKTYGIFFKCQTRNSYEELRIVNLQNKKVKKSVLNWGSEADRRVVAQALKLDQIALCSTDTVLGLLGNSTQKSHENLDRIKGRQDKPYLVLVGSIDRLKLFTDQLQAEKYVEKLVAHFCPGPLTIIFKVKDTVPAYLGYKGTLAIRIPQHAGLLSLLADFDGLFSTSANLTGENVARTLDEVSPVIMDAVAACIVDEASNPTTVPSTIIDVSQGAPKLVREGAISRAQLEAVLGFAL
jgi:L-threonylcarbamoyladenylate synthase